MAQYCHILYHFCSTQCAPIPVLPTTMPSSTCGATRAAVSEPSVPRAAPAGRKRRAGTKNTTTTNAATPASSTTGTSDVTTIAPPVKKAATQGHKHTSACNDTVEPSSMATVDAAPTPKTQLPPKKCPQVNKPAPTMILFQTEPATIILGLLLLLVTSAHPLRSKQPRRSWRLSKPLM